MGRLTEYFGLLDSENLEEDTILCSHLDCDSIWPDILEGRKRLRRYRREIAEPQLF